MDDQVDKIHGATSSDGQLKFYIQMKGEKNPILVPSDEAKKKYTYHVLDFYESRLVWESEDDMNESDDDGDDDDGDTDDNQPLATLKSKS